jgi:hypothetical protein
MKKITLGLSVLAVMALFLTSCNKKEAPAPVADTEFESAVDASYANTIATDIDAITGFMAENSYPKFFNVAPGTSQPTITVDNSVVGQTSMTWPSAGVKCADGKTRSGTIVVTYSSTVANAYYRDYGFGALVTLNNYVVDGWMVDDSTTAPLSNAAPRFKITSLAPSANPNPATTKLKWSIEGCLKITNVADPSKVIIWNGKLNKTISNTSSLLPPPNNLTPITWTMAVVEYDGEFKGITPGNVPYTYTVGPEKPLVRNYTCSSDKVLGIVLTPSPTPVNSEFHPFVSGVASFTTAEKDPRLIDYNGTDAISPCDNSGSITIKGIEYKVDFKK